MERLLALKKMIKSYAGGGNLLIVATLLAFIIANSPWSESYFSWWEYPVSLQIGEFNLFAHHGHSMNLMEFINDALMVIFFFTIGLEIKQEILVGELKSVKQALLPVVAAVGGMVVPVLIFVYIGWGSDFLQGSAIPMATDIAFSLGVLSMLGKRVPLSLKIFLTTLAVVDDIGGILVIAIFYSSHIAGIYLLYAAGVFLLLWLGGRWGIRSKALYLIGGGVAWFLFLRSGIHPTIAGVLTAFCIPAALLHDMEEDLHPLVNYLIIPLFAFANAGIILSGIKISTLFSGISLAIFVALAAGKFLGIFLFSWLIIKLKLVPMPQFSTWGSLASISMLGGIGFTVSLFIANLSFEDRGVEGDILLGQAKLGIIMGSLVAGVLGYVLLRLTLPKQPVEE